MFDGLVMLLFLSIIMGAASFLAGNLPLSFSLSPRQLRLITALGTGVLVGTSLIVIIPEGVETLYSAGSTKSHSHDGRGLAISARSTPSTLHYLPRTVGLDTVHQQEGLKSLYFPRDGILRADTDTDQEPADPSDGSQNEHGNDADGHFEPHAWIGVSLILGFILMYLIDTVPQTITPSSRPQRFPISLNQFSFNRGSSVDETPGSPLEDTFSTTASAPSGSQSRPSSTTVGLVIHAAADGIALGASSTAGSQLSFVIFVALMIHKAPAAFGLTSVLLKQGLTKRMARAHLIVFSLAAPVGALLTWAAVHLFRPSGNSLGESASTEFVTGVLLLFSGGTFLYVAMHTMTTQSGHSHDESNLNGHAGAPLNNPYTAHDPSPPKPESSTLIDTLVTVTGMLLPLLTQWGHAH